MTVKELIEKLEHLDRDTLVVVAGQDNVSSVKEVFTSCSVTYLDIRKGL
tara:strand:+ start:1318 stop:1464 length:147 start_codon:yes stop_codon:yes gene_type:complete